MEAERVIKLLEIYGTCPKCGSKTINPKKDALEIKTDSFYRDCDCGFKVQIEERDIKS